MRGHWRLLSWLASPLCLTAQVPEVLDSNSVLGVSGFDPVRGRIVRVVDDGTTWEWDGRGWFLTPTAITPYPYSHRCLAFDTAHGQLLLLRTPPASIAPSLYVHELSGWTELPLPVLTGQVAAHLVYDPVRFRRVLLTIDTSLSSLVTWEDAGQGWFRVPTAASPSVPGPNLQGLMGPPVFDGSTGRVMFLAMSAASASASMWWYDGVNWTQQQTATPPWRSSFGIAYDAVRNVVVMHGGGSSTSAADVWEWDGVQWRNVGPGTGVSLGTAFTDLMFDPALGSVLEVSAAPLGAPYVAQWNGSAWTILDRVQRPQVLNRLVHDWLRDATVTWSSTGTFEWRGERWVLGTSQTPSIEAGFFDVVRGAVVGVSLSQSPGFWSWNGSSWSPLPAPAALPPPRGDYALSFDPLLGRATLFGGTAAGRELADTWEWNGATWFQVQPTVVPPARRGAQMVRDVAGARTVLVGGTQLANGPVTFLTDTWAYNGVTWSPLAGAPPSMGALLYDDLANRTLAVSQQGGQFEVHELVGTAWQLRSSRSAPQIQPISAVFERQRGTIAFGSQGLMRLPVHQAVAVTAGAGCGRPLRLAARAWPRAGASAFGFDVQGAPGFALVAVSLGTANTPLGGGCTALLQSLDLTLLTVANAAGFGEALMPIPRLPLFRGLPVFAQAAQLDATSPIGVGLSARLDLVVGD